MRTAQVYYRVSALKDGTILVGIPARKPVKKKHMPRERIDPEGIFCWWEENADNIAHWTTNPFGTIANCLNFKRLLRIQVEGRLDKLETQMAGLRDQLSRIEGLLQVVAKQSN